MDYIWEIIPDFSLDIYKQENQLFNKSYSSDDKYFENHKIKVLYDTLEVQKFLVKNRPYQQLSDHFGVSVEFLSPNQSNSNLSDLIPSNKDNEGDILKDNENIL